MIIADEQPSGDHVQPFQIETPGLRGRLVRLGPAVEAVLAGHAYPPAVAGQLAEAMAMAAVLASGLKYDGIFTLQLQGDGPIRLMVVDVTSSGDMRGYARFDEDRLPEALTAPDGPVPRLFGAAFMSFTVDQGPGTDRYQGITPMEGRTLGDCCHAYFRQSEQIPTFIRLAVAEAVIGAIYMDAGLGKAFEIVERRQRIGDAHVGGCDDLQALDRAGRLDALLAG